MRLARRTAWGRETNRLTRLLADRRASGRPIVDLTESNPTRCGLRTLRDEGCDAWARAAGHPYVPDPRGLPAAREAIAADYAARGVPVDPGRIFLTASTSEAYAHLFRLLADPGDNVLVPVPSYPLFDLLCRINDVTPVPYPLIGEGAFAIDRHALARAIDSRTRAIIGVSPGNPTGSYLRSGDAEALAELARSHGIPILADEVFGDYALDPPPDRVATLAVSGAPATFVLNGLSKMLALPQIKLAWILAVGAEDAVGEALQRLEIIADTFLSVGGPVQHALPDLLGLRLDVQARILRRLRSNLDGLRSLLRDGGPCSMLPVEGGWSATLTVPRTRDDEAWAIRLLEADGILVHPGWFFDYPEEGRLVISLLPEESVFRDGCGRAIERIRREA